MSHRMSVLSRQLKRFAIGFSFATLAFFSIGLFAAANTKGQVILFFAGLVPVCLFATFFLWVAHGFAWAMMPEEPAEASTPAEAMKPTEEMKPAEPIKAPEVKRLAEEKKAAEEKRVAEAMIAAETMKAAEAMKAADKKKPAEEKVIVPKDPPDAKYTITGRRIS